MIYTPLSLCQQALWDVLENYPVGNPTYSECLGLQIVWPGQAQGVTVIALDCGDNEIAPEDRRGLFRDDAVRNYDKDDR